MVPRRSTGRHHTQRHLVKNRIIATVTRFDDFLKFSLTNFLAKVAQIVGYIFGLF